MTDASHQHPLIKRRWWLALLLLFASGIGYLYVGRPERFLGYLALTIATWLIVLMGSSSWLSDPMIFLGFVGVTLAILFVMAVDVVRLAVRQPQMRANWYNRWWIYLGIFLAAIGITGALEFTGNHSIYAIRTFSLPSVSNAPTLQVGDYIVVDNKAYENKTPERGDMVVFRLPSDESIDYVKRVIGLPGDKVQVVDGIVSINGVAVTRTRLEDFVQADGQAVAQYQETLPDGRSFATLDLVAESLADNTAEITVPPGHYYVLGDNRDNSSDSRFPNVGPVPQANIFARVGGIYYSSNFERIGTRIK